MPMNRVSGQSKEPVILRTGTGNTECEPQGLHSTRNQDIPAPPKSMVCIHLLEPPGQNTTDFMTNRNFLLPAQEPRSPRRGAVMVEATCSSYAHRPFLYAHTQTQGWGRARWERVSMFPLRRHQRQKIKAPPLPPRLTFLIC